MQELKAKIYDKTNGISYTLVGDYYIPNVKLPEDDDRPIGKWGRMHRAYLEETNPLLLNHLILTGKLHTPRLSGRPQRAGAEPLPVHRPADDGVRGHDRGLETTFPVGLDTGDEWHCQPRRGNHQERND